MSESWIVGINPVEGALANDASRVRELLVDIATAQRNARIKELIEQARSHHIPVHHRPREQLDKLAGEARHQGIVALYEPPPMTHEDDLAALIERDGMETLVLVLDGITDPHNLGACLRVADGVGAHAVIVPKDRAVGLNATAAKVASGAAETVPYITVTNLARTMRELKERDIWLIGTSDDADKGLYQADFTGACALVMGSEGEGMRRLTRETCDLLVNIPMFGSVESLNVSVASGVCLYEARRQRLAKEG
jgi:23S rRNA (guanosine2251-2'-O)-methyltransferase